MPPIGRTRQFTRGLSQALISQALIRTCASLALTWASVELAAQTPAPAAAPAPPFTAAPTHPRSGARPLSLGEAIRMAESTSEDVAVARAGTTRARGQLLQARSEFFPQLAGSLQYTRTLESQFSGLGGDDSGSSSREPCPDFNPRPDLPLAARVDSLERAVSCDGDLDLGSFFSDLPFGRPNAYQLGLSVSQLIFDGGRARARHGMAQSGRRTADIALASSRAQVVLDVAEAYYDATLADRLAIIAQAALEQSDRALRQTQLARTVGNAPEFDLLRAQVSRDNQRPVVIQQQATRDIAFMRLKQLLNLPLDAEIALTTELDDSTPAAAAEGDTSSERRAPVRQAAEGVRVQETQLRIARSQRIPSIALGSQYGRIAYPGGGLPRWSEFRTDWTVTAAIQVPLFTGFRIRGDELVAQANLTESRARLRQVGELAALDTRSAIARLDAARAEWESSAGTTEQASRAYVIAEVRYREGLSTQIELSDSRLLLRQAEANRAVAARNLQIARLRLALIHDLPLGAGGTAGLGQGQGGGGGGSIPSGIQPSQSAPRQQQGQQGVIANTSLTGVTP